VENLLALKNPHEPLYDTLKDGQLAFIPICDVAFCRDWNQGMSYNLLVVADSYETYERVVMPRNPPTAKYHREALPQEIQKATEFLGVCAKALGETLASDTLPISPMRDYLEESWDTKSDEKERNLLRDKLKTLENLKAELVNAGEITVPRANLLCNKVVLKIDMEAYMKISEIRTLDSGSFPYPDP